MAASYIGEGCFIGTTRDEFFTWCRFLAICGVIFAGERILHQAVREELYFHVSCCGCSSQHADSRNDLSVLFRTPHTMSWALIRRS